MIRLSVVVVALGLFGCDAYCREYGTCENAGKNGQPVGGGPLLVTPIGGGGGTNFCANRGSESAKPLEPVRTPPPITGGNMAAVGDGTWVIADADRAVIWHLSDSAVLGQVPLGDDDFPGRVLLSADQKTAYVVLRRANQIASLDLATRQLTRLATCTEPRALVWRGEELLVGCATGIVEVFSGGTRSVIAESSQLHDLRDLEVVDGRVLVSTFRNAQVFELQAAGPRVLSNPVSVVAARGADAVPRVAWRMRQGLVLAQNQQVSTLPPVKAPDGSPLPCSNTYGGGGFGGFGGAGGGPEASPGPMSSVLYRVEGDRVSPLAELTGAAVAVDMVETSLAVFVASAGTNSLVRFDKNTREVTSLPLPGQPTSLERRGEVIAVFLREPAQLLIFNQDGVQQLSGVGIPLAPTAFSTGHDLFHRATKIGIACASCHPEAGDDGHLWAFAEGARRTPSLRGGIKGTEPFHWDGAEPTMLALLDDVMSNRMNGPIQTLERSSALTDWIDRQPALRAPPVQADAVERGHLLFSSSAVGCESCHTGPQGTNNADADVGTGGSFQVPRLTEAFWRTPLLHDGSLPTLEARVNPSTPSTLHGRIDQLTPEQRLDLLEYLKTR